MSEVIESCVRCDWSHRWAFKYHGEVPVDHPICPSCGHELRWSYIFDVREIEVTPEEMAAFIEVDETGFPQDRSPRVVGLGELLDRRLEESEGVAIRVSNVEGVVDVELRPYTNIRDGVFGVKLTANVGRSVYSMALLELLVRLNAQLPVGRVVSHVNAYALPQDAVELFPFGTEVNLYFQHVIPQETLEGEGWEEALSRGHGVAAALARRLRHANRMMELPLPRGAEGSTDLEAPSIDDDELSGSDFGTMRLEEIEEVFLDDLLLPALDADELLDRIRGFHMDLGLEAAEVPEGRFWFAMDSARVSVTVVERGGRQLVRYHSVLLAGVDLARFGGEERELPARALTTLNDQIVAGRCLIEPERRGYDEGPYQVAFEKMILGVDLDLSEFALTLLMVAEEADRMDNLLQDTFGGLRADQLGNDAPPEGADLSGLIRRLGAEGLPGIERVGAEEARVHIRHMLEEIRLPTHQDAHGDFWFTHGSARFVAHVWQDERATYVTLRARVLRDVERTEGLAEALNDINRQNHAGAFVIKDGRHVDLVETVLADDLSVEEFAFALVSIGELADREDNVLQALFGGELAVDVD